MEQKGIPFSVVNHISYADDSVISKTLIDKGIGSITLFSFDKDQGLSEHTSPFDAVVHVIDGESEITIGKKKTRVSSGEMIIMPANVPHSLKAVSRFKMMLIMIRASGEQNSSGPIAV